MNDIKDLVNLLKKDRIKNLTMINILENEEYQTNMEINIHSNSIMCRLFWDDISVIYTSFNNEQDVINLFENLRENDKWFPATEEWIVPYLEKKKKITHKEITYRMYLPNDTTIDSPKNEIVKLEEKDAEIINNHWKYKGDDTINYVKYRIKQGINGGIRKDGKLVAWCLTHDDGAMGFLYVLDEYRKKGYAKDLSYYMVDKIRDKGKIPFAYIVTNNEKSFNLTKSLGFVKDRICIWCDVD